jgi:hypothetical protein
MEIVSGLLAIAAGFVFFSGGWPRWVLVGIGVFGLLPWGGAATILRRGQRDPSVFETDPARGRRRSRRFVLVLVPFTVLLGAAIGYAGNGWGGAAFVGAACGLSSLLGAWWFWRWSK